MTDERETGPQEVQDTQETQDHPAEYMSYRRRSMLIWGLLVVLVATALSRLVPLPGDKYTYTGIYWFLVTFSSISIVYSVLSVRIPGTNQEPLKDAICQASGIKWILSALLLSTLSFGIAWLLFSHLIPVDFDTPKSLLLKDTPALRDAPTPTP